MYVPSENSSAVSTSSGRLPSEKDAQVYSHLHGWAHAPRFARVRRNTAKEGASAVRDAHGAVHEALKLEPIGDVFAYLADIGERKLARKNDARCAELVPRAARLCRDRACLSRDMYLDAGTRLLCKGANSDVGDDHRIRADLSEKAEKLFERGIFRRARHYIHRNVYPLSRFVDALHRRRKLTVGEIIRSASHAEALSGKIHGIRAVEKRRLHFSKFPHGDKSSGIFIKNSPINQSSVPNGTAFSLVEIKAEAHIDYGADKRRRLHMCGMVAVKRKCVRVAHLRFEHHVGARACKSVRMNGQLLKPVDNSDKRFERGFHLRLRSFLILNRVLELPQNNMSEHFRISSLRNVIFIFIARGGCAAGRIFT